MLDISFDFPQTENSKSLTLRIEDMRKSEGNGKLSMPLPLNRPERIDLQFMPEGGDLIVGQPAHIAFKAINEDGSGAAISGKIYNSKSQEIVEFHDTHRGIGTFDLIPQAGETYSAKISLPNGAYKTYDLPAVQSKGITLHVDNPFQHDSCEVIISATPDIAAEGGTYYIIGHARGVVCYGAIFNFNEGIVKRKIGKEIFPSGIVRFTLVGPDKTALNERIIFIDHADNLNIQLTPNKASYKQRDSVGLSIQVSDESGAPVQGSFSLAVTDNGQVKVDSIADGSILTHMLLSADLKGTVEDPGYYIQPGASAKKWADLDQLLLAQGWIGYDWNAIFKPAETFTYPAEQQFLIKGRVTNMFNKPVAGSGVVLLSKNPLLVADTVTNDQGRFTFTGIVPVDTAVFFLQSRNKKGKSFNVGIEVDEFEAPVFRATEENIVPWYVNIDTSRWVSINKQVQLKKEQERINAGSIMLKEVVVTAKRVVKDSKNLNGPGEADVIVDQEELEKSGRTTLGDLLRKNIEGFGIRADKSGKYFYWIHDKFVHLIIDGMDTEFFKPESTSLYQYFKDYFDYYDAEEIKGIEVMTSSKYTGRYRSSFLDPLSEPFVDAFIEVTTRAGKGPFVKKSVGTYLYKPMPYTIPKKFYSPKYTANSTADMTDIRSTVYWKPDIITDKEGKATVTFYTADNPGNYMLMIEGSDMHGKLGIKRATLTIR